MNENSLDGLIAKIKSEAIEGAEKEAQEIIKVAKSKAKVLIKEAETEKQQLIERAQAEAKAILEKGEIALQQSARDVHISVQNDIIKLLKSILETEIKGAFSDELYSSIITNLIKSLGGNVTIAIPDDLADELTKDLKNKIAHSKETINIMRDKQLLSGLSVSKTDEGWSYNISAEEVSELLSQHLSQKWVDILKTN